MYQKFYIQKYSGTYSEALEAFGVAKLIEQISKKIELESPDIYLYDKISHYEISIEPAINQAQIDGLKYFIVLPFIKKEEKQAIPTGIPSNEVLNYPEQKSIQEQFKKRYEEIDKNKLLSQEAKKHAKKALNIEKNEEFDGRIKSEFDVMREIISKPYDSYLKIFENFHKNKDHFPELINEILNYYSEQIKSTKRTFKLVDEKPNGLQLYNPHQSKGSNRVKADTPKMDGVNSNWIAESMKISGALTYMSCQFIKVGSSYDMKVYVPSFNETTLHLAKNATIQFKKYLKSLSPIKLDIINIISFSETYIEKTKEFNYGKLRDTIRGFYSAYQKSLGNARGVTNISFIQTPDFINYTNEEEAREWIEILSQQKKTILSIEENGDAIQGLEAYRCFLGATGHSALGYFSKFSFWYAGYLMQQLSKDNRFVRTFKIEHLNKFYKNMEEPALTEIIENEGFQAVAKAIRKSTVSLQYTPKDQRKFEIRYGLPQLLQNKSKSKADLASFIGEFISIYNAETAKFAEKNEGKAPRENVKDGELTAFYKIIDETSSPKLIGSLLTSYGFALHSKDKVEQIVDNQDSANEDNQINP